MGLKQLGEVQQEMAVIKAQLEQAAEMPDPEGDEVARSKVLEERANQIDDLVKRFDELQALEGPLLERSRRLDEIKAYALSSANVDGGDGAAPSRFGANFNRPVDPFDTPPSQLSRKDLIDRARRVVGESRLPSLRADSKEQVDGYIQRGANRDTDTNLTAGRFDGTYIAMRALLTENPAYQSAFQKYAAGRNIATMTRSEQEAVAAYYEYEDQVARSMSENTTTAGGFGIPILIDPTIILTSGAMDAPLLRVCRVETVTNNLWNGVSSAGMSWSYTTESTEVSDNSPTLAQPTVRVHMPKGFIPYTIEVGMDYPGFADEMGRLINQGYTDLLATKTMTGTGTNEPFGIFVAASTATDVLIPTTDGAFGGVDIFATWAKLPERFRPNATWVMSVSCQNAIRAFAAQTTVNSAYFTIDLTGGTFSLNGRPVIVTDYAPTFTGVNVPGTTGLQNILCVGDWQQGYLWVNRAGMTIEQIPNLFGASNRFPLGQRGLFAYARNGGNIVNTRSQVLLQNQ